MSVLGRTRAHRQPLEGRFRRHDQLVFGSSKEVAPQSKEVACGPAFDSRATCGHSSHILLAKQYTHVLYELVRSYDRTRSRKWTFYALCIHILNLLQLMMCRYHSSPFSSNRYFGTVSMPPCTLLMVYSSRDHGGACFILLPRLPASLTYLPEISRTLSPVLYLRELSKTQYRVR